MERSKVVRIGVTPYVRKYIMKTYGPTDKFYLAGSARNDLRISLINLELTARTPLITKPGPGCFLNFDLGEDPALWAAWEKNQPYIKIRSYYEYEFQLILRKYIEAQADLARRMGLSESQYSGKVGLDMFLEKYEIEEWEYSYESLRRQWNRVKTKDLTAIEEKLGKIFDFSGTGYPVDSPPRFSPPLLYNDNGLRICFHAYSRSEGKTRRCRVQVPAKLAATGQHHEWTALACKVITNYLQKGFTVR